MCYFKCIVNLLIKQCLTANRTPYPLKKTRSRNITKFTLRNRIKLMLVFRPYNVLLSFLLTIEHLLFLVLNGNSIIYFLENNLINSFVHVDVVNTLLVDFVHRNSNISCLYLLCILCSS